jgi:hypothetical protein
MKQYLKRTWKNKLIAILLVLPCVLATQIEGDATVLVLALMVATPLFFAKRNYIV